MKGCGWRKRFQTTFKKKDQAEEFFADVEITKQPEGYYTFQIVGKNETLHSNVERLQWNKDKQGVDFYGPQEASQYSVTRKLNELFGEYGIELQTDGTVPLLEYKDSLDSTFWKRLFFLLKLITQIRNQGSFTSFPTTPEEGEKKNKVYDFIHCPQCGFHSDYSDIASLMALSAQVDASDIAFNGDANGALNIARKGVIAIEQMKKAAQKKSNGIADVGWGDMEVTNDDWDAWMKEQE
jgi:CRISPR-associated protein Cpf1